MASGVVFSFSKVVNVLVSTKGYHLKMVVIAVAVCLLVGAVKGLYVGLDRPREERKVYLAARAGIQWSLQAIVAYLAEMAKRNAWWVDWPLVIAILLALCHVVCLLKSLGHLHNIGSGDALLSIFNVIADELLKSRPTLKFLFTSSFATLVLYMEQREKINEQVRREENLRAQCTLPTTVADVQ